MSIIALITFLLIGSIDCQAQRAKKHRDGVLSADSIRAKNEADSLALLNNDEYIIVNTGNCPSYTVDLWDVRTP